MLDHDCRGVAGQITGNHIYDTWKRRQFDGAEQAGIKIHASIDMLIKNNRVHGNGRGIWMDWMAQGTRITANPCYDNSQKDLYVDSQEEYYRIGSVGL